MPEATTQSAPAEPQALPFDIQNLKTTYANVCRIGQTQNEVIVDFGLNPNFFGSKLIEPLKMESRIILTHDAAKRTMLHLASVIQAYEATYGVIELDPAKRVKKS